MLAAEPDIAEIVMRALILRRTGFISHGHAVVSIVGSRRSADTLRLQRFLTRNGHPVQTLEPDVDAEATARLVAAGLDIDDTPVAILRGELCRAGGGVPLPLRRHVPCSSAASRWPRACRTTW